ncbi:MAG: hypothetical protein R6V06_03785 [Kiritimatiellia bacterium]
MNESGEKNNKPDSEPREKADTGGLENISLDLDFAPSWARTSPEEHLKKVKNARFESGHDSYGRRDKRYSGRRDNWRDNRNDRFSQRNRDNKSGSRKFMKRRDGERDDFRKPNPRVGEAGAPALSESHTVSSGGAPGFDSRGSNRGAGDHGRYRGRSRSEHPPLPLEIRVLPEQKALGGVIRRIQSSHRAFPLRDIAWLFLDKPASCLIRIAQQKDNTVPLYQCKVCGMPALSEEKIQEHLVNRHLDDFFDVEEVECDPPGGQFVCVMRCGITGELLGPPNHHSYNAKVHEMLRSRFPNMSEESYRRKIESVRDPEVIEEWRQSCTRKKIYRRKTVEVSATLNSSEKTASSNGEQPAVNQVPPADAAQHDETAPVQAEASPEASVETDAVSPVTEAGIAAEDREMKAPPMERDVAEMVFRREILPDKYASVKHLVCVSSIAMQTPDKELYFAIKNMIQKERRFPTSLFFALRGAFRHRKLHMFRANEAKGPDFVIQKKPVELDPSHAVDMVKDIIAYIHDHPACTKTEMIRALAGNDEAAIKEVLGQLMWLIEKSNVIEYYNDVLSVPLEHPAFRLLPGEKKGGGRRSESVAAKAVTDGDKKPVSSGKSAAPEIAPETEAPQDEKSGGKPAPETEAPQDEKSGGEPVPEGNGKKTE